MISEIEEYINKFGVDVKHKFLEIRELVLSCTRADIEEKLWAKLPSYCVGDHFVRIIPFRDHLNIVASGLSNHLSELNGYKMTPKGMLQIYVDQAVPNDILSKVFQETLE